MTFEILKPHESYKFEKTQSISDCNNRLVIVLQLVAVNDKSGNVKVRNEQINPTICVDSVNKWLL